MVDAKVAPRSCLRDEGAGSCSPFSYNVGSPQRRGRGKEVPAPSSSKRQGEAWSPWRRRAIKEPRRMPQRAHLKKESGRVLKVAESARVCLQGLLSFAL